MPGIFISYRRADSDGWAGRLRDALRARFGDLVFQDVDNIADGEIFSDVIDRALNECDVALIIIGPSWANARDEKGRRRLDVESDWVRTETAMVLNRKIRVIPVLVGGARLPPADELPEELSSLTKRQAREIRSTSWDSDVALLASHLEQIVGTRRKRVWLYATPAVIAAAVVGIFAGSRFFAPSGPPSPPAENVAAKADDRKPRREESIREPALADASRQSAGETEKPKSAEAIASDAAKTPAGEAPKAQQAAPATPVPEKRRAAAEKSRPVTSEASAPPPPRRGEARKPPVASPVPSEATRTEIARAEPPTARPVPRRAPPESARSADTQAEAEAPAERASGTTTAGAGASGGIARVVPINLPNRPASARELRIGDNWTYRLRELAYNKNLATVTHEIRGGDASGIREIVRAGSGEAGTQRRLPLEARMFEQPLDSTATLFEFAPFMIAFSDLRPGISWPRIAVGSGSDDWRLSGKVIGRERVRLPAGTFDAIKAELEGRRDLAFPPTRDVYNETVASHLAYSIWYVPEIGRAVKYERRTYNRASRLLDHEQYELVSYQLK